MPFRDRSKRLRDLIEAGYGDRADEVVGPWLWEARFTGRHLQPNARGIEAVLKEHGIDCKLEAGTDEGVPKACIAMHEEWLAEMLTDTEVDPGILGQLLDAWPLTELESVWRLGGRGAMAQYWLELGAKAITVAQQGGIGKVHT